MLSVTKMCLIVAVFTLLAFPKVHTLIRDAQFVASYHEQSVFSVTNSKAKIPPGRINSVFQCARYCVMDIMCTRYEFCFGEPEPCTLFESGSTCSGDLENNLDLTKCTCFTLKYMKYEDQSCRCSVGNYGDNAQCCENVILDCTHGNTMPALSGRTNIISLIKPSSYSGKPFEVQCSFDLGGFTTIQKRSLNTGCTDFNRNWEDYRTGFGSIHDCHWLGLEKMYNILQNNGEGDYKMNINMVNGNGKGCQSIINGFNMGNEDSNYTVKIQNVNTVGNLWCAGIFSSLTPDGQPFSTTDHSSGNRNCIIPDGSGWWFADDAECSYSNLNTMISNGKLAIKFPFGLGTLKTVKMTILMI